jgi:hypothetical protein
MASNAGMTNALTVQHLSQLEDMPTELIIEILKASDPKDVLTARQVSDRLFQIIERHDSVIAEPTIKRELNRLQQFVDDLTMFDEDTPFHHVLAKVMNYHGFWKTYNDRWHDRNAAIDIWILRHGGELRSTTSIFQTPARINYLQLNTFAHAICDLHIHHHLQRPGVEFEQCLGRDEWVAAVQNAAPVSLPLYNIDAPVLVRMYDEITSAGGFSRGVLHDGTAHDGNVATRIPLWPLTYDRVKPAMLYGRSDAACDLEWLKANLGLPDLPSHSFVYCVKTKAAYDVVRKAMADGFLMPLDKAAILEDLILF